MWGGGGGGGRAGHGRPKIFTGEPVGAGGGGVVLGL